MQFVHTNKYYGKKNIVREREKYNNNKKLLTFSMSY